MSEKKKNYEMAGTLDTSMRFAIYANSDRFNKHRHAWKVWRTLRDFGCIVYPVAEGLSKFEGCKFYPDLESLLGKVDVVIPCLKAQYLDNFVENCAKIGARTIWFQETNWTPSLDEKCKEHGLDVIRGCVLKHKIYPKPLAFFHPCYWHGWRENKVPKRYHKL